MVQELVVKCPHCQQVAEIFLSTNACVIVLNCPTCSAPIMYFDHKIFILSEKQLEALKNNSRQSAMNELKKMVQPPQMPVPKKQVQYNRHAEQNSIHPLPPQPSVSRSSSSGKISIGRDEITDLKIELALCNDVQEFIDKM